MSEFQFIAPGEMPVAVSPPIPGQILVANAIGRWTPGQAAAGAAIPSALFSITAVPTVAEVPIGTIVFLADDRELLAFWNFNGSLYQINLGPAFPG